jgi:hypothetical protein
MTTGGAQADASGDPKTGERRLTILYTAEVHGAVEPCGCTSNPLGDISRFAALVGAAKKEGAPVLLVDAGGLLYAEGGGSARERPADDLRAAFLASQMEKLGLVGAGLAETDLSSGPGLVHPKRLASNFAPSAIVVAPLIRTVGVGPRAVKVGVLGIADPALAQPLGAKSEEIAAAVRRDADRLRQQGAELVVLLAPIDKPLARRVARSAAVDLVILGRQVGRGLFPAEAVARSGDQPDDKTGASVFLVAPADELQRIGRIDIVLRTGARPGLQDAGGPEAVRLRQEDVGRALKQLDADLARWSAAGPSSGQANGQANGQQATGNDPAFVAAKRRERDALIAERATLDKPRIAPASGSYFINRLIPVSRALPRDPTVVAAMKQLDGRIGALNSKNAQPPPPAEPGRATFAGVVTCGGCHARAVEVWKKTVHAAAWKTLVDAGKQADYKCVGCHLTGYGQVGGSALGFTKGLQAVQCENCHGPASLHVAAKGLEEPSALRRAVPETTCLGCHNEQHSDTFEYQAYLRDILGPGHGAEARRKLGDGPTAHALRATAQAKAKVTAKLTADAAMNKP